MIYSILIFESTHKVLKAEQLLIENNIKCDIIPTPKELSSACGISIRLNPIAIEMQTILTILEKNTIDFTIYEKEII